MPQFMTADEAVLHIKDGDCIINNAFLAIINPAELMGALGRRREQTGSPGDLTIYCAAGFGDWSHGSNCEAPVRSGAVKRVIASHFSSTPETAEMAVRGDIEAYNLPLGPMSHMIRMAASNRQSYITQLGLNLFVDPKNDEYKLNPRSTENLVEEIELDGKRQLKYNIPAFNVAFIKASSADKSGNISFEKECLAGDSLSVAQAVHRAGGKVIVQVERITEGRQRPWNALIPGALVDIIAICPEQKQIAGQGDFNPAYSGDEPLTPHEMREMILQREASAPKKDTARARIARRAAQELKKGDMVNIGVGIPEGVSTEAARSGMIEDIVLTVESGPVNGVPASGKDFGSAIGPHSIWTTAQMFDFYDGGGLNVTFLGGLEIDGHGNVNSHRSGSKLSGIGGFANISQSTPRVVFCLSFTAGGLEIAEDENGQVSIINEGRAPKFVEKVSTVSFSAVNARENGQQVLYITERCVFRLGAEGLELIEVAPGIDLERDILQKLPFQVKVSL